jgi:hypothetical protein
MQHDDLTVKLQNAVAFLKNHPMAELAMQSCQQCGMTYLPLLQQLSHKKGAKHGAASLRRALKELITPASEFPPLLLETSLRILGRSGAPTVTYIPTEFGRQVLAHMKIQCPNPHNEAARKHLYIQLELMTRALEAGWTPEVEKHLATVCDDDQQNIRVDVFIKRQGEPNLYLEAEQELTSNNISRAEEKFDHWQSYSRHFETDAHFHIVFNVARERLGSTLQLWRKALSQLASNDRVLFQVSYALLVDLVNIPLDQAIHERFTALTPIDSVQPEHEAEADLESLSAFARQVRSYQPHRDLGRAFEEVLYEWREAYTAAGRVEAFFALMRCIHRASDLRESGEVFRYNLLPINSLALLYRYLTLEENQSLYDDLRQAIQWVQGRNLGVTLLREINTQIIWDVFLAHHDFARGGKLQVSYEIADHMEKFKSFGVLVSYNGSHPSGSENSHPDDAALEWVLTALFTYSEILGLGRLPWKKKPKGGGA